MTVDSLLVPETFDHELAGLVKIDFKALDQWLEEMRCVKMAPVTSRTIEAGLTNAPVNSEVLYHPKGMSPQFWGTLSFRVLTTYL
jgi:hypothetical protein